jgi:hypothetical protein
MFQNVSVSVALSANMTAVIGTIDPPADKRQPWAYDCIYFPTINTSIVPHPAYLHPEFNFIFSPSAIVLCD